MIMKIILVLCAIIGVFKGFEEIRLVETGIKPGCVRSKNLFSYLFSDKY